MVRYVLLKPVLYNKSVAGTYFEKQIKPSFKHS